MRLIAAALFAGLALIAVAVIVTGDRWVWLDDTPSYKGYESVIRTWFELERGLKVNEIETLKGSFYRVLYSTDEGRHHCLVVDVSKQYADDDDEYATFWWSGGVRGFGENTDPFFAGACR